MTDAFLPVVAPASAYWLENEHYDSEEAFVYGLADALHDEYKAIVDAGLMVQVDDAVLMHEADSIMSLGGSWEDYRKWAELRVDALNHALQGLPEDRVRYHICWGSWHGPHVYDPPLKDVIDMVLKVNAGTYAMEQSNARHEHEWRVWEDVKLPEGKKLIPGVVTHHTNVRRAPGAGRPAAGSAGERRRARERARRAPTAASPRGPSCGASTRRSSGRSLLPCPRARSSPRASSGAPRRRSS